MNNSLICLIYFVPILGVFSIFIITFCNNMAGGHHQHIFHPLFLLKRPFKKMKAFFFSKKNYHHQISIIFPNLKFVDFCKKTSTQPEKRHFYEIISFDTHSTANLSFVQLCYNLVKRNFQKQNRRTLDTFTSDIINWEVSVRKCSG